MRDFDRKLFLENLTENREIPKDIPNPEGRTGFRGDCRGGQGIPEGAGEKGGFWGIPHQQTVVSGGFPTERKGFGGEI